MATCPVCDADELEVDEYEVDEGDIVNCPECGASLEVTQPGAPRVRVGRRR